MVGPAQRRALLALLFLWNIASPVLPQRTAAGVHGTVTDATGAVLPGATVTLTGVDTGFSRTVIANSAGIYLFGELQVGSFEIRAELDGFKTTVVRGVELNVAEVRRIDIVLELGAISDEITAVAEAMPLDKSKGELASLVSGKEIRELPLNGRNFTQLTQLMPGVTALDANRFSDKGLIGGVGVSVSGGAITGNLWTVDGVNNNDPFTNVAILVYPSVDAIEEFKIHRNSYGAEFGGASAAQINLVTRGGSNQLRGSAFFFYRHHSLNEKNYFLEQSGGREEDLDRKDFGFTLGGPILRDRLHFFVSQEWNDETRGTVRSARVPTVAERNGDFSASTPGCSGPPPVDPRTGALFPGGVIPPDRISPGGRRYLDLYNLPNTAPADGGCSNWVAVVPTPIDWRQTHLRFDWSANKRTQVLLRYTDNDWDNTAPNAGVSGGLWGDDPFPVVDSSWESPSASILLQVANVLGSSAVNTLSFSYSGNEIDITRGGEDPGLNAQLNALIPPFFPEEGKTTGAERSHPVYFGGATGDTLGNVAPFRNDLDRLALKDDYQQVLGEHWLKAGVLYSEGSKLELSGGTSAAESPQFWGGVVLSTGNRIADILLADVLHGFQETSALTTPEMEWQDLEVYVADTWRPHPRLTLDAGIRYSYFGEPNEKDDAIVAFYPSLWDPSLGDDACNGMAQVPGTDPCGEAGLQGGGEGVSRSLVRGDTDNFAPRLGLAWDVRGTGTSVLRAGFGQFFQRERMSMRAALANQPPFTRNAGGLRRLDEPGGPLLAQRVLNWGLDPDNETPYSLQFNLTWEQRLRREMTLEVSYVGSRGRHLLRRSDVNQVPQGDANGNGTPDRLEYVRGTVSPTNPVRPYFTGPFDRIVYVEHNGESEYDALQTQLVTRFGRGSQAQVSYTWSRFKANDSMINPTGPQDPWQITDRQNPDLDWGYAGLHRDHMFNTSVLWNLPTLQNRGTVLRSLLGDWAVGGILIYTTGAPLTVYNGTVPGLTDGQAYGTGFNGTQRPLRVSGVSCEGSGQQVVDPGAFTLNGLRLGDVSQGAGRGICEGPDFFQIDLSFYKRFRISERVSGQFRIEIFNVLDEVNFIGESVDVTLDPFNVVLDAPLSEATRILSAETPAGFGRAQAARDPRQIQLGIKLFF